MAVLQCGGCPRLISVSAIAGGNPIAKANPEQWAQVHVRCPGCGQALCDRCAVEAGGQCKLCGATLPALPGSKAAPSGRARRLSAATRSRIDTITWGRHWGLLAIVLQGAVPFVIMMATSNAVTRTAWWLATLMGLWAGWKMLGGMGVALWRRLLASLILLVPLVSLLMLVALRGRAAGAIADLQATDDDEDEPAPRRAAAPSPAPAPAPAKAAPPGPTVLAAVPSSPVAPPIDAIAQRIAQAMGKPLRAYSTFDFGRDQDPKARSILVPKDFPLDLLMRLRKMLPPGLVLFLGTDRWLGDEDHGAQVELVIAPGKDYADMVRTAQVDPVNHGLDPDKVAAKLRDYDQRHGIRVYNASTDTVGFQFVRLPDDLVALARDLMDFCPDLGDAYATAEEYAGALKAAQGGVTLWWD